MRASLMLPLTFSLFTLAAQAVTYEALVASYQPTEKDRSLQKRFARYDGSGDALHNMREFAKSRGNSQSKAISRANLLAFLKADVSGDGLLSEREYLASHRLGKVLFAGERAFMFGMADNNRDGQLKAKEWARFARRAAETASLASYDDDHNGAVSWMEWLGQEPTVEDFLGAHFKDLKRVLPESLRVFLEREASVHADLILGARDNPWTREVLQQLALFAPSLSNQSHGTITAVGTSYTGSNTVTAGSLSLGSSLLGISNLTSVNSGTLNVGLPSSTLTAESSTIGGSSSLSLSTLTTANSGTLNVGLSSSTHVVDSLTIGDSSSLGLSNLSLAGSGTLNLISANTYTGSTTVISGTLSIAGAMGWESFSMDSVLSTVSGTLSLIDWKPLEGTSFILYDSTTLTSASEYIFTFDQRYFDTSNLSIVTVGQPASQQSIVPVGSTEMSD